MSLEQAKRMGMGFITPWSAWPVCGRGARTGGSARRADDAQPADRDHAVRAQIWEGAGLGLWVVCAVELFRHDRAPGTAGRGRSDGALGPDPFPRASVALALLLAAVPYGARRRLPDRSRNFIQASPPIILTGFPALPRTRTVRRRCQWAWWSRR